MLLPFGGTILHVSGTARPMEPSRKYSPLRVPEAWLRLWPPEAEWMLTALGKICLATV